MVEDFVTYEQAVRLKELGFDWECNHYCGLDESLHEETFSYLTNYIHINESPYLISAPTLSQAQKWLREVKGIHIEIKYTSNPQYEPWVGKIVILGDQPELNAIINTDTCDTYEEALSEGIDMVLKILKK